MREPLKTATVHDYGYDIYKCNVCWNEWIASTHADTMFCKVCRTMDIRFLKRI